MRYEGYELDYPVSAAQSAAGERAAFIRRVYAHLAGAVLALIGIMALLLTALDEQTKLSIAQMMLGGWSWLVVMLLFMGAGFVARVWAQSRSSPAMQYMGLGLYVVAWAVVFLPLLILVQYWQEKVNPNANVIAQAGILTGAVFGGLTLAVFVTKKDFSFLGPVLCVGSLIALGVIVAGILFGFTLGLFFCFAMVALISGYILYDTSNVMLHYPTDMHVAAALELLADVAMLFWYIVQILMSANSRD
jgi:FtsH-binding integral membrane protein